MSTLAVEQIVPGSKISIKIVSKPTNLAAGKTLVRLMSKDTAAQKEINRYTKIRKAQYDPQPRGGRLYAGRLVKQFPLKGKVGEQGTILATVEVIRSLSRVARFIEVQSA